MFRLTQIGPEGGDCTAPYTVTFDKVYTLEEFVNAIIINRSGEWGSIRLGNLFGKTLCEYKWGKIIRSIPDEYKSRRIASSNASGGWSAMDYYVHLLPEESSVTIIPEHTSAESGLHGRCKYYDWRTSNEAKYLKDPTLLEEGAFKDTCTDEILIARVGKAVESIYNNPDANIISATMTFIQYLYEVHKLPPEDCELLGDIILTGMNTQMKNAATTICECLIGMGVDLSDLGIDTNKPAEATDNVIDINQKILDRNAKRRELAAKQKIDFVVLFIDQYFDPQFVVERSVTNPCSLDVRLMLFIDKEHNYYIDPKNCNTSNYTQNNNSVKLIYDIVKFVYKQMEEILNKSGFTAESSRLISKYLYGQIDQNLMSKCKSEMDDLLWRYINTIIPYRGKQNLQNELIRRYTETLKNNT